MSVSKRTNWSKSCTSERRQNGKVEVSWLLWMGQRENFESCLLSPALNPLALYLFQSFLVHREHNFSFISSISLGLYPFQKNLNFKYFPNLFFSYSFMSLSLGLSCCFHTFVWLESKLYLIYLWQGFKLVEKIKFILWVLCTVCLQTYKMYLIDPSTNNTSLIQNKTKNLKWRHIWKWLWLLVKFRESIALLYLNWVCDYRAVHYIILYHHIIFVYLQARICKSHPFFLL